MATDFQKGMLSKLLGEVPSSQGGPVLILLPDRPGEDAVLRYDGKEFRYLPEWFDGPEARQPPPSPACQKQEPPPS